jgi:hypothetical protein
MSTFQSLGSGSEGEGRLQPNDGSHCVLWGIKVFYLHLNQVERLCDAGNCKSKCSMKDAYVSYNMMTLFQVN